MRRTIRSLAAAITLAAVTSNALAEAAPGEHIIGLTTPQAQIDLNLPVDFFTPGSGPIIGPVDLIGEPINRSLFGDTDTIIKRGDIPPFPTPATIPIEIVALSLQSVDPIVVDTPGGPQMWDLFVTPDGPQNTGILDLQYIDPTTGKYFAQLPISPLLTFVRVDDVAMDLTQSPGEFSIVFLDPDSIEAPDWIGWTNWDVPPFAHVLQVPDCCGGGLNQNFFFPIPAGFTDTGITPLNGVGPVLPPPIVILGDGFSMISHLTVIPEPATAVLLIGGCVGVLMRRRGRTSA